jgi:hypothetical protein
MTIADRIERMSGSVYMGHVARLGCLLCRMNGIADTPSEVHHARKHGGKRSNCDKDTIPLCLQHHRIGPGAVHNIRRRVEEIYGISEEQMAAQTREHVAALLALNVRYMEKA